VDKVDTSSSLNRVAGGGMYHIASSSSNQSTTLDVPLKLKQPSKQPTIFDYFQRAKQKPARVSASLKQPPTQSTASASLKQLPTQSTASASLKQPPTQSTASASLKQPPKSYLGIQLPDRNSPRGAFTYRIISDLIENQFTYTSWHETPKKEWDKLLEKYLPLAKADNALMKTKKTGRKRVRELLIKAVDVTPALSYRKLSDMNLRYFERILVVN
jgi:hypothetical protein